MSRVLVIGAKGMLGRDLCPRLRRDFDVFEADIEEVDITDYGATQRLAAEISPDEVVNAAAYTNVDGAEREAHLAYEINAEGARNVARAASAVGARCTYIGTDFIFDGSTGAPYLETDQPGPLCVYAKSKLAGELYVIRHAKRYLIPRTAWLFGVHGKNFVEAILRQAEAPELRVVNDQTGSPTYAVDLSESIARLLKTDRTGVFNCVNSSWCSWFDFAKAILNRAGYDGVRVLPITARELGRPAIRPRFSALDNTKLKQATGLEMPTWEDALTRYLKQRQEVRGDETNAG